MAGKLLQALGALFVLGLVGGAAVGFMVMKDRVKVVVSADDDGASGPDPIALLRDDVRQIAAESGELQQSMARNFEQLGAALEERANARHAEVLALRQELASARGALASLVRDHADLRSQLAGMPAALAAAAGGKAAPEPVAAAPVAVERAPVAVEPAPVTPAPSAPKTGFLSFTVPTTKFRFEEPQDYTLVADLCSVGFDAKSTLHDFTGKTSAVRGAFRADFDDPEGRWTGEVIAQAATLVTGVEGRDDNLRDHLDTKTHAEIRFAVAGFRPAKDGIDVAKQTVAGEVHGTMTIRGRSLPVTMPVRIELDAQKRVVVTGQTPLKLSDYGVPVPSQLGLINMQDEVVVWIALRARAVAGSKKQ